MELTSRPKEVRGLANVCNPKVSEDFVLDTCELSIEEDDDGVNIYSLTRVVDGAVSLSVNIPGVVRELVSANFTLTVTDSSTRTVLSGMICRAYYDDELISQKITDSQGQCTWSFTPNSANYHNIKVEFIGDNIYAPNEITQTVNVEGKGVVTTRDWFHEMYPSQPANMVGRGVTVKDTSGNPIEGVNVIWKDKNRIQLQGVTNSHGRFNDYADNPAEVPTIMSGIVKPETIICSKAGYYFTDVVIR